jgi:hypothetical protein
LAYGNFSNLQKYCCKGPIMIGFYGSANWLIKVSVVNQAKSQKKIKKMENLANHGNP